LRAGRPQIAAILVVLLLFPTAALAAGADGGHGEATELADPGAGHGDGLMPRAERSVAASPLSEPGERFEHSIHAFDRRLRAQRRAAARRRQAIYARLPGGVSRSTLAAIAACESGGDPTAVSADGTYRGLFQFDYGTWESVGGHGDPAAASEAEQDYRAALLYARSGPSPWPVCG
jgi:hypothetical protein